MKKWGRLAAWLALIAWLLAQRYWKHATLAIVAGVALVLACR